ncbi:MAG: peptide ABC transporter substrate-binding protein [Candidatus Uhrbacteria bacterium]
MHPILSGIRSRLRTFRIPSTQHLIRCITSLSRREQLALIGGTAALILGATVALVGWYRRVTVVVPDVGGTYVEGLLGSPRFVNPLFAPANDVDQDLVRLIYAGLFRIDEQGSVVPDLAESYTVGDDGKTITVVLRDDARWHDGANVTIDDVRFTISLIQGADAGSPLRGSFRGITLERVDDYTLKFTTERPLAVFLTALTVGIIPEHLWVNTPPAHLPLAELNLRPIGTGPFRFVELSKDKHGTIRSYTLERYEGYHTQPPWLDRIVFRFYMDTDSLTTALRAREIDGIGTLLPTAPASFARPDIDPRTLRLPQTTALFLNKRQNSALDNLKLRRALSVAIDRSALITDALGGAGVAIGGPIIPGFANDATPPAPDEYDAELAASILDGLKWERTDAETYIAIRTKQRLVELEIAKKKAGTKTSELSATEEERAEVDVAVQQELNSDQPYYRLLNARPLSLTITIPDADELVAIAEHIRDEWLAIGVSAHIDVQELDTIRGSIIPDRSYEILLFSQILGPDPDPFPFWHSSQVRHPGLNLSYFSDRNIDKLLEDARATLDRDVRGIKYSEFQERLLEERPAIFLITPTLTYPMTRAVHGVTLGQLTQPADRFATVTQWYIETTRARPPHTSEPAQDDTPNQETTPEEPAVETAP